MESVEAEDSVDAIVLEVEEEGNESSLFWGVALLLLLLLHSPSINLFGSWSDHEVVGGSLQLIGARGEVVDDVPHLGNVWSLVSGVHLVSRSGS